MKAALDHPSGANAFIADALLLKIQVLKSMICFPLLLEYYIANTACYLAK